MALIFWYRATGSKVLLYGKEKEVTILLTSVYDTSLSWLNMLQAIAILFVSISALVVLIARVRLPPFLALLLVSLVAGFAFGLTPAAIIRSMQEGFGETMARIGLIILLGSLIGAFLEHSGGALVLAMRVLQAVGTRNVDVAMAGIGYLIAIPVFCDSGFLLMSALNRSLTRSAGLSLANTSIALALGLACTHVLVPPTPGPLAAAGILGADLSLVIGLGLVVAAFAALAGWLFARKVAASVWIDPGPEDIVPSGAVGKSPGVLRSALPIFVPLLLIMGKSVARFLPPQQWPWLQSVIMFLGEPLIALLIGFGLCLLLPAKLNKEMLSANGWVGKALSDSAGILLITGAGGIFGKVLQQAQLAEMLGQLPAVSAMGIWLPFGIAAALKTAQGSSTVAIVTTASLVASLMPGLGLHSEVDKALTVLAIGAGSLIVSHVNDSYFWVVTQLSRMSVTQGYRLHTLGTLVIGLAAMVVIYVLLLLLP
jgi:GntP family gluconate:H+ symporter